MPYLWSFLTVAGVVAVGYGLAAAKSWLVNQGPCLHLRPIAQSAVPDHEGPCAMTWYGGGVFSRFDGGVTGFFRRCRRVGLVWVSFGPEFHGIAAYGTDGKTITSTASGVDW